MVFCFYIILQPRLYINKPISVFGNIKGILMGLNFETHSDEVIKLNPSQKDRQKISLIKPKTSTIAEVFDCN